jgi:hypothetical protein
MLGMVWVRGRSHRNVCILAVGCQYQDTDVKRGGLDDGHGCEILEKSEGHPLCFLLPSLLFPL